MRRMTADRHERQAMGTGSSRQTWRLAGRRRLVSQVTYAIVWGPAGRIAIGISA
jgi:hypothetical protein